VAIVDVCTGMLASDAILAALNARARRQGAKGRARLDLARQLIMSHPAITAGRDGGRFGNGIPASCPYTTYQAADAMMALAIGNERRFARAAEVGPEWATDNGLQQSRPGREPRSHRRPINAALARDTAESWLSKLKAVGVPCGRINSVAEALDDPHTAARRMIESIEHPSIGKLNMLGIPFKFSDTACSVRRPPPLLGEHNDEILSDELGYDANAIVQLRREKVI
jgi:crotonobetainyl-CoA:carnitine CoA-transferase CaiB-like acyl-CoA transferase